MRRLLSCVLLLLLFATSLSFAAAAQKESYVWGLREAIEYAKTTEIEDDNLRNADKCGGDGKIALCVCAEGVLSVGTKYRYELVNEPERTENELEQPANRRAAVRDISGAVYGVNGTQKALRENDEIAAGTSVRTEAGAKCALYFDDTSYFQILSDSELLLSNAELKDTVVKLVRGKAWAYVQPIVYDGSFTVELANADLKIKGTIFAVEEGPDYSAIWMFTGAASVISAKTKELTDIEAGQKATFYRDGAFALEYFSVTQNIEQWGIPITAIRADSGYAWVKYFVLFLCIFTPVVLTVTFAASYRKKKKKKISVSKTAPKEGHCRFCGNPLEPDDTFCKICGAAVKKKPKDPNR